MNFQLTEERQMLQETLRKFLAKSTDNAWQELAELGVIGALFNEEHGGFGGSGFDLVVVFEELGRANQVVPLIDAALIPGRLLIASGNNVDALIAGTEKLAFAHTEQAARYDLNWVETRVDKHHLSGEKTLVAAAEEADSLIVSARLAGTADSTSGIGLWRVALDAPGLTLHSYDLAQGGRASEVTLNNTPGTPLMLEAYDAITDAMAAGLLAQSAETLGAIETSIDMTREYMGTRKQFGRTIGSFQALSHRLVDLMVELEQARSAVILGAGHLHAEAPLRDKVLSATKNILGRSGRRVAEESIQLHGGIGMTQEYSLGRYAKRIVMADHRFGDTDHHLERFIDVSH